MDVHAAVLMLLVVVMPASHCSAAATVMFDEVVRHSLLCVWFWAL